MKVVLLSDIHSNKHALKAVLRDVEQTEYDRIFLLGDIFGYYPWASESYELLKPFLPKIVAVKGNHDALLLTTETPNPEPSYWKAAQQNRQELLGQNQQAMEWLQELGFMHSFFWEEKKITLVHGTPDNAESGRFYPDNSENYSWFPKANEWMFGGHTHYPLHRQFEHGGHFVNPGSVGQPREGEPSAKWATVDFMSEEVVFRKSAYNQLEAMHELTAIGWDERAIKALNKTKSGTL